MCVQAAYLQKGGVKTAVLERRHVLGGAAVSEEIFPGTMLSCRVPYIAIFVYILSYIEKKHI